MSDPVDDPIVGHATFVRDGVYSHRPIRKKEADVIQKAIDENAAQRTAAMPTEESARHAFFNAWLRLKELGWQEAKYCPKDGSVFEVIEAGSTGVHRCHYQGQWPTGTYWIHGEGDPWPSRPVLFRTLGDVPMTLTPADRQHDIDVWRREVIRYEMLLERRPAHAAFTARLAHARRRLAEADDAR